MKSTTNLIQRPMDKITKRFYRIKELEKMLRSLQSLYIDEIDTLHSQLHSYDVDDFDNSFSTRQRLNDINYKIQIVSDQLRDLYNEQRREVNSATDDVEE